MIEGRMERCNEDKPAINNEKLECCILYVRSARLEKDEYLRSWETGCVGVWRTLGNTGEQSELSNYK